MIMKEFYETYHLNKYLFGEMAHVGARTLLKYDKGLSIQKESKRKIELAIKIIIDNNMIKPVCQTCFDLFGNMQFHKKEDEYKQRFKELLKESQK